MKTFFTELYHRVILSYKSTLLGLLVSCIGYALLQAQNYPNPNVKFLAGLALPIFLGWKDRAVAAKTISLLAVLFFASASLAQTPSARTAVAVTNGTLADVAPSDPAPVTVPTKPQLGGCFRSGYICIGPTATISVAAVNLSKKTIEGAFSPGVGLGLTFNPNSWASYGVSGYLNLNPGTQNANASVMASFLNGYARVGWSKGFIGDVSSRLLFGIGIDL